MNSPSGTMKKKIIWDFLGGGVSGTSLHAYFTLSVYVRYNFINKLTLTCKSMSRVHVFL